MKNVVPVLPILPSSTIAAAAVALAAVLPYWNLGDDETAVRTLASDLAFDAAILNADPSRSDILKIASKQLRMVSARYRRAVNCDGIDDNDVDDWALASPDAYGSIVEDRIALAA